jgi:hypothetical protein
VTSETGFTIIRAKGAVNEKGICMHALKIAIVAAFAATAALGATQTFAQPQARAAARPARIAGQPNLNGVWQAIGTAHWNLEAHSAEKIKEGWQLGSLAAIPAGQSVVDGDGKIPYLPEALAKRDENRADWVARDPEVKCYLPGIPRATYMPYPFQIIQGGGNILFAYEYASANRVVYMSNHQEAPIDTWMGWSNGRWDGDTLVVETTGNNDSTWFDRAGNHHSNALKVTERFALEGDNLLRYSATIEDPQVFSRPWTISMPLYRRMEPNVEILEFKCVPFVEELLYKDLELPK